MDLANLKEIILIQSEIIKKLARKYTDNHPPTKERQDMFDLLEVLNEKIKSI